MRARTIVVPLAADRRAHARALSFHATRYTPEPGWRIPLYYHLLRRFTTARRRHAAAA
jgi:hypothetical protein